MFQKSNLLIAFLLLCSLLTAEVSAQKTSISLEIDPATFAFKGYSAHIRVAPASSKHFLLGAGIYAMEMPAFMVDLNSKNKGKGWEVRLNRGVGLFGEYHFQEVNRKWFTGVQTGIQEFRIGNTAGENEESFSNLLFMGYTGYTFKPFDFNLYFKPWAGVGYTSKISGETRVGDLEYDVAPMTFFLTLHVGYTF